MTRVTLEPEESDRAALLDLRRLLETPAASSPIGVHLASTPGKQLTYEWLLIERTLAGHFAGIVAGALEHLRKLDRDGPLSARSYCEVTASLQSQIEYLELTDPKAAPVRGQLAPLLDRAKHGDFVYDPNFVSNLRFYVISVGDPKLHLFRALSPKSELARSRRFGIIGGESGTYDLLREHVLLFDTSIDCLLWKDRLYILNRQPFKQMFRYFEVSRDRIAETLKSLEALVPIKNFAAFSNEVRGSAREQKLLSIGERSYVREKRPLDWASVQEVIDTFNLKVAIVKGPGDSKHLQYDSAKPWELYNLLDDDYLISEMTSQGYEAAAKELRSLSRKVKVVPTTSPKTKAPAGSGTKRAASAAVASRGPSPTRARKSSLVPLKGGKRSSSNPRPSQRRAK